MGNIHFENKVIGHPAGLFILFFTEMWERFSYYGMRALLVLFLVSSHGLGGWEWTNEEALSLYATYTGLVYITPIIGGLLADKFIGYRRAVVIGAFLMTLGHASMAFESESSFYLGLVLLIIGNGFFKPNISTIVGGLYKGHEDKKDAGYTIFYMGINAGAFLGILLCGYIGEKVGWSYGFGLAGVFMFVGMLQFWFAQSIFGQVGLTPLKSKGEILDTYNQLQLDEKTDIEAGFDEKRTISEVEKELPDLEDGVKKGLLQELKDRFKKRIISDRLLVIGVLAFFTIFFWMAFEQAGGSMTIFAKDFTKRILTGGAATTFTVMNMIITIVPLAVITWVLILLFRATFKKYYLSNIFLGTSFLIIWGIVIWMLNKEFNSRAYDVKFTHVVNTDFKDSLDAKQLNLAEFTSFIQNNQYSSEMNNIEKISLNKTVGQKATNKYRLEASYLTKKIDTTSIRNDIDLKIGDVINIVDVNGEGKYMYLSDQASQEVKTVIKAEIIKIRKNEVEVPASWFGVLNSLFIILFAPLFSKLWESKYNPSAPVKFAIGLMLLGLGFGVLAYGSMGIGSGTVAVSMVWLILAYLFHTLGELSLSPVGLSYVSKLAPAKLVGLMFGVWFTATAIANWLAGKMGSLIDKISEEYSLSVFFLIFTILPILAGFILIVIRKWLVKKMHGVQ